MSDEAQPAESQDDAPFSLSSLDLGPAWARGGSGGKTGESGSKEKRRREDGGGERRRDGRRDDRREPRRDDRRDARQGGGRRFDQGGDRDRDRGRGGRSDQGRGRRRDDRDDRQRREEIAPPEGFTAEILPVEDGLDRLAKEILAGGRTYSVFDLAKLVLGGRERFNVNFRTHGKGELYRCVKDGSLWLTKQEALAHFWRSDWHTEYYEEVITEAERPSGNFQSVARCGLSGEWLGPPNYHGYQTAIMQLHRERFSNMPIDLYKKKVRMERGEEAVAAWLEQMSKHVNYRPVTAKPPEEAAAEKKSEAAEEKPTETPAAETPETEAPPADSEEVVETPAAEEASTEPVAEAETELAADEATEAAEATPAEPAANEEPLIVDKRLVEKHFLENRFEEVFLKSERAWVPGNVPGNDLSPGLLTLLRYAVAEERRYPGKLTPMLCRQLSGRHVAVFKWRRKLKAGPSRPHPVPDDITIADRPMSLLTWVKENSGQTIEKLWKALLPSDVSDEEKRGWYHDLHWLLNQGYALLMADSTIHLSKKEDGGQSPGQTKKKGAKKKAAREGAKPESQGKTPQAAETRKEAGKPQEAEKPQEVEKPQAVETPNEAREPAAEPAPKAQVSGLYSLSARTLSGMPKAPEALTGRGLSPLPGRAETAESEDEDEGESLHQPYF